MNQNDINLIDYLIRHNLLKYVKAGMSSLKALQKAVYIALRDSSGKVPDPKNKTNYNYFYHRWTVGPMSNDYTIISRNKKGN